MKLFYSPTSPYVRKVSVIAELTGLAGRIERVTPDFSPIKVNPELMAQNPLSKVPVLVRDDGTALYDSTVICQYLDDLAGTGLYPKSGNLRWLVLRAEALADGLLDAAVLMRYESNLRPADKQWSDWCDGQLRKVASALAEMEHELGSRPGLDAGHSATVVALGYLRLRMADMGWEKTHPKLAEWFAAMDERPEFKSTRPA
ncbi:MAG: glutathione S-transferase [Candidatus Pacebacteria bacterium]|nr:glutathione S-transferase [Candidatus Paceibacterota bacterium]